MSLEDIPEIPPYPTLHSVVLYSLPDVSIPTNDKQDVQLIDDTGATFQRISTPERQPQPVLREVETEEGVGQRLPPIPECGPSPTRHDVFLYSFSELSNSIPEMRTGSQQMNIDLDPEMTEPDAQSSRNMARMSSESRDSDTPLNHAHGEPSSISSPEVYSVDSNPAFRERSISLSRGEDTKGRLTSTWETERPALSASWWGEYHAARPWQYPLTGKSLETVPQEQAVALEATRVKVAKAVSCTLGTTADVVHETLYVGVDTLELAPVPRLSLAARTLLNIWDAALNVDMNRLGCLHLTERCADILISVREEVHEAGDEVGVDLAATLTKLEEAYTNIFCLMVKQTNRPWLKRYLKRYETLRDIAACHSMLHDALSLFGLSIQIRVFKQVQESERRREREIHKLLDAINFGHNIPTISDLKMILEAETETTSPQTSSYILSSDDSSETVTQFATTKKALSLEEVIAPPTAAKVSPAQILPALTKIHNYQISLDATRDLSDLRQLMRSVLQTSNDAELLEILHIGRQEVPDAVKTLQRTLERLAEQDEEELESIPPILSPELALAQVTRKFSVKEGEDKGGNTQRSETIVSIESSRNSDAPAGSSSKGSRRRDTLDREFIESAIDALTRMSQGTVTSVPSWTITKYEVDRVEKISVGSFADVYKGTWGDKTVAIKVLADTTPRNLFLREIGIWKALRHANVLPLYGASSATGEPPWFFVSPYMKLGSLVEHLKRVETEDRPLGLGVGIGVGQVMTSTPPRSRGERATTLLPPWVGLQPSNQSSASLSPLGASKQPLPGDNSDIQRQWDLFRFMHEIAQGMEYLHSKNILHGDLKASNVLVDHKYRCVISDFGLSEMKSETFWISGTPPPHGTLRWQSPEFMAGRSQLTQAVDVWAFGISCAEILTMGRMPWPSMDDNAVRDLVLNDKTTPPIPKNSRFNTPGVQELLRGCWQFDPNERPSFRKIAQNLKLLRSNDREGFESPSPGLTPLEEPPEHTSSPSPDMRPIDTSPQSEANIALPDSLAEPSVGGYDPGQSQQVGAIQSLQERTIPVERVKAPAPVIFTPRPSSRSPSNLLSSSVHSEDNISIADLDVTLPLWEPTPVELGAVGYLSRPKGAFVTLFNAFDPSKSDQRRIQSLPSIRAYGAVKDDVQRLPKKTITRKALDMIVGSLSFRNSSEAIVRRATFPLKAGHKAAYLYTEITEYRYMITLGAPKAWFRSNVDAIMSVYGSQHCIQKEDLFLIIGTLRTPKYALFVSHSHPEGYAHFNVYANPKVGQPWGTFTTDAQHDVDLDDLAKNSRLSASKVSIDGGPWDAVLLARLRFKPDNLESTSL